MIAAGLLGAVALGLLAAGALVGLPVLAGLGLTTLALAEAIVLLLAHGTASLLLAVPAAALLLLAGELAFVLAEGARPRRREDWARLARELAGAGLAAVAGAIVVLGADAVGLRRSGVATVAGAALAAALVWLLVRAVSGLAGEE